MSQNANSALRGIAIVFTSLISACGGGGGSAPAPAPLPAAAAPQIVSQPAGATIARGETANFSVAVGGSASVSYQWRFDGVDVEGATGPSVSINTGFNGGRSGMVSVAVSNAGGTTVSQAARLTVLSPSVQSNAGTIPVEVGTQVIYAVNGGGTPQSYQWQINFSNIAGATGATLTLPATLDNSGIPITAVLAYADGSVKVTANAARAGKAISMIAVAGPAGGAEYQYSPGLPQVYKGMAFDPLGDFYLSNWNEMTHLDAAGKTAIFPTNQLGTPPNDCYRDNLSADANGNAYWADGCAHIIRKFSRSRQEITTLTGGVNTAGAADGDASTARFKQPAAVVANADGTLYVADMGNHTIRKVSSRGDVTTFAGSPAVAVQRDGTGAAAGFERPQALARDAAGNLYVGDYGVLRKVTPAGVVSTVAGMAGQHGVIDGAGSKARFNSIDAIVVDRNGVIWIADNDEGERRDNAQFTQAADPLNNSIRQVSAAGEVTTVAGRWDPNGVPVNYVQSKINRVTSLSLDGQGNVVAMDQGHTLQKLIPGAISRSIAGWGVSVAGFANGQGTVTRFDGASIMAADGKGNVLTIDANNNKIRQITADGLVSTRAKLANEMIPPSQGYTMDVMDLAVDPVNGDCYVLYVSQRENQNYERIARIDKIRIDGTTTTVWGQWFNSNTPTSIALDRSGALYASFAYRIPDFATCPPATMICPNTIERGTVVKFDSAGNPLIVAGSATAGGIVDGAASAARFSRPSAIRFDGAGNLYIVDSRYEHIRKLSPAGLVTTLMPNNPNEAMVDAVHIETGYYPPKRMAIDAAANVYVTSESGRSLRKLSPAGQVTTMAGPPYFGGIVFGTDGALYTATLTNVFKFNLPL